MSSIIDFFEFHIIPGLQGVFLFLKYFIDYDNPLGLFFVFIGFMCLGFCSLSALLGLIGSGVGKASSISRRNNRKE